MGESESLKVPGEIAREIKRHAEAAYPEEACGVLMGAREGNGLRVERAALFVNEAAENRGHRYWAGKGQYETAEREAREAGLEVVGVWHSHPDSPPAPSSVDAEYAFPGWVYWIVEVRGGTAGAAGAWRSSEAGEGFQQIEIKIN